MLNFFSQAQKDQRRFLQLARQGDAVALLKMIQEGQDVNVADSDGMTALLYAVQENNQEATDVLIKNEAKIDATNRYGNNCVILAAKEGHDELMFKLINAGGDVNRVNKEGWDAITYAYNRYNYEAVTKLLNIGANLPRYPGWLFHNAVYMEGDDLLQALLDKKIPPDLLWDLETSLHLTVRERNIKKATMLVNGGACFDRITVDNDSLLSWAIKNNENELVQALIERHAPINALNKDGWTALHQAVYQGNSEQNVSALLKAGADSELKTNSGYTALTLEVNKKNNKDMVRCLLDHGVEPKGTVGKKPVLIDVIERGWLDIAGKMLEKGADLDVADTEGMTARGYLKIARDKAMQESLADEPGGLSQKVIWKKPDDERIIRCEMEVALGRVLKDIFNFSKRERLSALVDPATGKVDAMTVLSFDKMPDKELLREALTEFEKQGGKAAPEVIYTRIIKRDKRLLG